MNSPNIQVAFATPVRRFAIAMISGICAIVVLYYYLEKTLLENSGGERTPVLVATKVVRPGARIEGEGVAVQLVPRAYLHGNSVRRDDQDKIVGRKVYRNIAANQPILWSDFDPPENERATMVALTKGMRAVAVVMGEPLRKARILKMGDSVDVIFHFTIPQGSLAITLFQHVVVIDQRDEIAVLMLTPDQTEEMAFALAHGQPILALRNREDTEQKELKEVTFTNLLRGSVDLRLLNTNTGVVSAPTTGKTQLLQMLEKAKQGHPK